MSLEGVWLVCGCLRGSESRALQALEANFFAVKLAYSLIASIFRTTGHARLHLSIELVSTEVRNELKLYSTEENRPTALYNDRPPFA